MDITKCAGIGCPLKENCLRYIATPDKFRQSYFIESPYKDKNCEHFIKVKNDTRN